MSTSRRNYLTLAELAEYADITITDDDEAFDQISQAEEQIDAYVGYQDHFFKQRLEGKVSAGGTTSFTLDTIHKDNFPYTDYFVGCIVEILGGAAVGERKRVTASTQAGVLTTEPFSTPLDTTSFYRIYQLGKFPRCKDVSIYTQSQPQTYYKMIPEAVKRAIAAQVQYIIDMGPKYFSTDKSDLASESIGDYSYSKKPGAVDGLIAPKAKALLKGIVNRTGEIIIDDRL